MIVQSRTAQEDYALKYREIRSTLEMYLRQVHCINMDKLAADPNDPLLINKTVHYIWKTVRDLDGWVTGNFTYTQKLQWLFQQEGLNLLQYNNPRIDLDASLVAGSYYAMI